MKKSVRFWEQKTLAELSDTEWESLCDGCGRCCLNKLEDEDTGEVHYTDIACKLFDTQSCRCKQYDDRVKHVPDCIQVRDYLLPMLQADTDSRSPEAIESEGGQPTNVQQPEPGVQQIDEQKLSWLPGSCAYVKVFKGEPLSDWHPLISGSAESVQAARSFINHLVIKLL